MAEQTETSVTATVSITNLTRNETAAALDGLPVGGRLQAERKPVKVGGRRYDVSVTGIGTSGAESFVGAVREHMETTAADLPDDADVDLLRKRITREVGAKLEARAEVERLRAQVETQKGIIQSWQNVSAPEDRPAFVLPERQVIRDEFEYRMRNSALHGRQGRAIADADIDAGTDKVVLTLLAEHAVTEDVLAAALLAVFGDLHNRPEAYRYEAVEMYAHLTGKAEG